MGTPQQRAADAVDARVNALLAEQRAIYDTLTTGIAFLRERVIENCNARFAEIFGYDRAELIGKSTRQLYPSDQAFHARAQTYPTLAGGPTELHEMELRRKDGSAVWIASRLGALERDDLGHGVVWAADDVTERRRNDQLLRLEHSIARCLAENNNASVAIQEVIRALCETQRWECGRYWRADEQADLLRFGEGWSVADEAAERFVAGSRGLTFARGKGLAGAVWQSGEPLWVADVTKDPRVSGRAVSTASGIHGAFLFPVAAAGKTIGVMNISSRQVRAPDERLLAAVRVIGSQVGQFLSRKEAERVLRESEERFRSLTELSSDYFWEQDEEYRFTRFEGRGAKTPDGVLATRVGMRRWETGDEIEGGWDAHRALLDARQSFHDVVIRPKDGAEGRQYVSISGAPIYDAAGRFRGYRGVSKDITRRKRNEAMMQLEHAIARCLAEEDDVAAALRAVMRAMCETQNWQVGVYWSVDAAAEVLRFAESWHGGDAACERMVAASRRFTFARGAGLAGHAWATGEPIWVADVRQDPRALRKDVAVEAGTHGVFHFPVSVGGKPLGVFTFSSRSVRAPDDRLLDAVHAIGSQVGQYLSRKEAERVLRESEERFRSLTELGSDWYWEQDEQFRFISVPVRQVDHSGTSAKQLLGTMRWDIETLNLSEEDWARHRATLERHEPFHDFEMCRADAKGERRWVSVSGRPIFDEQGLFKGYRGIGKDITERKRADERIQHLAHHDGLTGLPNRAYFNDILGRAVKRSGRYAMQFAVLFIDLDGFKGINDTLGHEAGDMLLKEIGRRLTHTLRTSDIVARLGGDEFVALIYEVSETSEIAVVARKILSAVVQPMTISGQDCRVSASIGIARFPTDAREEESLLRGADAAMYHAKEEGKNNYQFYSAEMRSQSLERLSLESSLRRALERNEFALHYQAKLDLKSRAVAGVEALLRWQHPELGMVPPARFIPLAEETGLIVPIGRWVLFTACRQNMAWQRAGLPPLRIAVNLSARQFAADGLMEDIEAALAETAMPPQLLELELTESMVMRNPDRTITMLNGLKALGVRLAIDDFGVGYSSLAQIKRFPVDTLKVDRSFIRDLERNSEDRAITKAIINMGKTLGLTVVAEGVETGEQETFLRDQACDEMQGYFFNRPVASEEFAALLQRHLSAKA